MTTKATNQKPIAPRAALAAKPISPLMQDYVAWLKAETGYDVDPMSVQLSGVLRGAFQKSDGNQKRITEASARLVAEKAARAERKTASEAKPKVQKPVVEKPRPALKMTAKTPKRRRPVAVATPKADA